MRRENQNKDRRSRVGKVMSIMTRLFGFLLSTEGKFGGYRMNALNNAMFEKRGQYLEHLDRPFGGRKGLHTGSTNARLARKAR